MVPDDSRTRPALTLAEPRTGPTPKRTASNATDRQAHAEGAIAELKYRGLGRARCRGTRLLQRQLLAAATAVDLKRLLSHHDVLEHGHAGNPAARLRSVRWLTSLLARCLDEIHRLTTADSSAGA